MEETSIFIKKGEADIKLGIKNKISFLKSLLTPKILIIMINCIFFLSLFSLFFYFFYFRNPFSDKKLNKFDEFLPKITMSQENYIPSVFEVFNSRELFISDINLTLDYINYIRPIDEKEELQYKKKLYPNLIPDISFMENRSNQIDLYRY